MATTQRRQGKIPASPAKQRPVYSRKFFPVQVAVFEYENEGRLNHSVSLTRTFRRDDESEWETTHYLSVADLLPAEKLLSEAYAWIQTRLQRAYEEGCSTQYDAAAGDESHDAPTF